MKVQKIAMVGDSTGVGWVFPPGGVRYTSATNEFDVMLSLLVEKFGCNYVSGINWSVGGTNTRQWAYGDPSIGLTDIVTRINSVESVGITMTLIQLGINDAYNGTISPTEFEANLRLICNAITGAGRTPVLQAFCPVTNPIWAPRFSQFQQIVKKVSMDLGVQLIDHYSALLSVAQGWTCLQSDGTHPTDELYRLKGHATFCALISRFI